MWYSEAFASSIEIQNVWKVGMFEWGWNRTNEKK